MKKKNSSNNILFILCLLFIFLCTFLMSASFSYNDFDSFFHIKLGQEMINQHTVITTAIDTFAGNNLPYVPHEVGFQLIIAFLYNLWGWHGTFILTTLCISFLIWGLLKLSQISRKEMNIEQNHPFLMIIIMILVSFIYLIYFKVRPQMLSAPIIIWFFVTMRYMQIIPTYSKAIILGFLSLLLSNVHSGVWLIILVFYIMAIIESLYYKKITKKHFLAMGLILIGGVLNAGGINTLLYFNTIKNYTSFIAEWHPIDYGHIPILFVTTILFFWSSSYSMNKSIFRIMLFISISYLGLSNYKEYLYLLLFIPYFMAVAIESIPILIRFKNIKILTNKVISWTVIICLCVNLFIAFLTPYEYPYKELPVKEMDYILNNYKSADKPKVLAEYDVSGYVMFRGANIFTDGRSDPFMTDATKGIFGWNAIEMAYYGLHSLYIPEVINSVKPDYLILPKQKISTKIGQSVSTIQVNKVREILGKPNYSGDYGDVWYVKGKHINSALKDQ